MPERRGVDVFGRASLMLDLRVQHLVGEQEAVLAVVVPGERVDGQHARGAPPFAFEREEPVPRADVEDGLAGEVWRESVGISAGARSAGGHAIADGFRCHPGRAGGTS